MLIRPKPFLNTPQKNFPILDDYKVESAENVHQFIQIVNAIVAVLTYIAKEGSTIHCCSILFSEPGFYWICQRQYLAQPRCLITVSVSSK